MVSASIAPGSSRGLGGGGGEGMLQAASSGNGFGVQLAPRRASPMDALGFSKDTARGRRLPDRSRVALKITGDEACFNHRVRFRTVRIRQLKRPPGQRRRRARPGQDAIPRAPRSTYTPHLPAPDAAALPKAA